MSFFARARSLGERLFRRVEETSEVEPEAENAESKWRVADLKEIQAKRRAREIVKIMAELGTEVDSLRIDILDDTAIVRGTARSLRGHERLLHALSSIPGVERVDDQLQLPGGP